MRCAQSMKEWLTIRHAKREAINGPHQLANWARRKHLNSSNLGHMRSDNEPTVDAQLSKEFFIIDNG